MLQRAEPIAYIIDDDSAMIDSMIWMMDFLNVKTKGFLNAADFLNEFSLDLQGCIVTDVRMPNLSGVELQAKLKACGSLMPLIFISGYVDVNLAVQVMKEGALDFLVKPFKDQVLLDVIHKAFAIDKLARSRREQNAHIKRRFAALSARELKILEAIMNGDPNKMIAHRLQVSLKTVEAHRASLMNKLGVKSILQLAKIVMSHDFNEMND